MLFIKLLKIYQLNIKSDILNAQTKQLEKLN